MEQHSWRKSLISAIEKTESATINLLTCDWLLYDLDDEEGTSLHPFQLVGTHCIDMA